MGKKTEIKTIDLVRAIRDRQARALAGQSPTQVIAFFRKAGELACQAARPKPTKSAAV